MDKVSLIPTSASAAEARLYVQGEVGERFFAVSSLGITPLDDLLGEGVWSLQALPGLSIPLEFLHPLENGDFVLNEQTPPLTLPAAQFTLFAGALAVSWESLQITFSPADHTFELVMIGLALRSDLASFLALSGRLTLAFQSDGSLNFSRSGFQPAGSGPAADLNLLTLALRRGEGEAPHELQLGWRDANPGRWLQMVTPHLLDSGQPQPAEMMLSLLFTGAPTLEELRLDWGVSGGARSCSLFGITLTIPAEIRLSLMLQRSAAGAPFERLLLLLTLGSEQQGVRLAADFAWLRELGGELLRDIQPDAAAPVLERLQPLSLELAPAGSAAVTVAVLDLSLDGGGMTFLQPLTSPLPEVDLDRPRLPLDLSREGGALGSSGELAERFNLDFAFSLPPGRSLTLPFLNRTNGGPQAGSDPLARLSQYIEIQPPTAWRPEIMDGLIDFAVPAAVKINQFQFATEIPLSFSWDSFALRVEHPTGLDLQTTVPSFEEEFLGLHWTFNGRSLAPEGEDGRFALFKLTTDGFNYQLKLAAGAEIIIEYGQLSVEPIRFRVSEFAVSEKGLTLAAEVLDDPVTLNGINTRFRFAGSQLIIVENELQDLTLRGAGPLPPDLVGEAMVDAMLQFGMRDGRFTLISGGAELRGDKLLDCKATRFQFAVDAIGLKFVNENGFHLYFTLTGQARFVLAKGDDADGALGKLPNIEIEMIECPLTGDPSVIAKHVKLVVEFPKPVEFSFLGSYTMALKAIGFIPAFEPFDGDACMQITGQVKFAQGSGDSPSEDPEYHTLSIGLPAKGSFYPRLHFENLPLALELGQAVKLNGILSFVDTAEYQGFTGQGQLEIQGLPPIAAAFAFARVWHAGQNRWVRAWFVYIEASRLSLEIPKIKQYIREIGLGFGYRYTLVSIRRADEQNDLRQLLHELRELSRTQADLANIDRWAVDLEPAGHDPRWTIVLRALMAQNSASRSPLVYNADREEKLANLYLLDVVAAFRSDLTFFMTARGWINTNYHDFVEDVDGLRARPIVSGFVLLSVRQKRFLAHVASNPGGYLGRRPALPPQLQQALRNSRFSATLLVEPGLTHFELGWPNMLSWTDQQGPLTLHFSGGFIFRVTRDYVLLGISFLARGEVYLEAERSLSFIGAKVVAQANLNLGGRFIGKFDDDNALIYAGLGIDIRCTLTVVLWLKIDLWLFEIDEEWRFELNIGITARLELGLTGPSAADVGVRGAATVSVGMMGHSIQLDVGFAHQADRVAAAYAATKPFLSIGLEATDADPLPGIEPGAPPSRREISSGAPDEATGLVDAAGEARAALANTTAALGQRRRQKAAGRTAAQPQFLAAAESWDSPQILSTPVSPPPPTPLPTYSFPHYFAFVVDADSPAGARRRETADLPLGYFTMLPQGEREDGQIEPGFLPVPPAAPGQVDDFALTLPELPAANGAPAAAAPQLDRAFDPDAGLFFLWHYDPAANLWRPVTAAELRWIAAWTASILIEVPAEARHQGEALDRPPQPGDKQDISLAQFVTRAFLTETVEVDGGLRSRPLGDPRPLGGRSEQLADERVHHPTEQAFEAAVRGAREQFEGSPFFKNDPDFAYDRVLDEAFDQNRTLYTADGHLPEPGTPAFETMQENQQAHQMRGVIVNRIIADLQKYAEEPAAFNTRRSIPFQLGLVFAYAGTPPDWLVDFVLPGDDRRAPTVRQRLGPEATAPGTGDFPRTLQAFNPQDTNFRRNSPQFERVRHFTDAGTIAIAWDLAWSRPLSGVDAGAPQANPEHHLMHYEVRRRALDGQEQEVVYYLKAAQVLNLNGAGSGVLQRLKPRFQVVDHFREGPAALAALPVQGKSYLYTITPVDFNERRGRPLSLIATRFPTAPPPVPADGELRVRYEITAAHFSQTTSIARPGGTALVSPEGITLQWSERPQSGQEGGVGIDSYRLIFRRDKTLPIGSYGLDSATQRSRHRGLPTGSGRPLPTDIKIVLAAGGPREKRQATLDLAALQEAGIYPAGPAPEWRPESWQIFMQTVSAAGVPSSLAPVSIILEMAGNGRVQERRPAGLEWLPRRSRLPLLPPEDMRGQTGTVHVPMPDPEGGGSGNAPLARLAFRPHPAGLRLIRFRWNRGPSHLTAAGGETPPRFPLEIIAGYELLELDVDAHTRATFTDPQQLAAAVRRVREVEMMPAGELPLEPGDTLSPNLWEAWYPSHVGRLRPVAPTVAPDGQRLAPWHSWRESVLVWPDWPALAAGSGGRPSPLHPALAVLVEALQAQRLHERGITVEQQVSPPAQAGTLDDFWQATAPESDPYGWRTLQTLGLATTLTVRRADDNRPLHGEPLLALLAAALAEADLGPLLRHLHVELLFQPGRRLAPHAGEAVAADSLLAMVQLSLRPLPRQIYFYRVCELSGPSGTEVELIVQNQSGPLTAVNLAQPDGPPLEIPLPDDAAARAAFRVRIGPNGRARLVLRGLPDRNPAEPLAIVPESAPAGVSAGPLRPLPLTDEGISRFSPPADLGVAFAGAPFPAPYEQNWRRFKRYCEATNSTRPGDPKISLPLTNLAGGPGGAAVARYQQWSRRFFDHCRAEPFDGAIDGPALVTAYPQPGDPALVSVDATGRLTYDHLLSDKWGHVYRYYLRPYGRYDRLWAALEQGLAGDGRPGDEENASIFDPQAGGLDIVLDRLQPVAMPLVLSSRRLDVPLGEQPSATRPGRYWEVLVARHPEQALSERNRTLARQLAYRRIAFTLLRRYLDPQVVDEQGQAVSYLEILRRQSALGLSELAVEPVAHSAESAPPLPGPYPAAPDHLDPQGLTADQKAALALPIRQGTFQQGAMALQWESLPFYYEHQLLLIAQTETTVSPINTVRQRDFEYVSPPAAAAARGGVDSLVLTLPLARYWDSLPLHVQARWEIERPRADVRRPAFRLSELPDPDVTYLFFDESGGTLAVQQQLFFDLSAAAGSPAALLGARQIGDRFRITVQRIEPDLVEGQFVVTLAVESIEGVAVPAAAVPDGPLPDWAAGWLDIAPGDGGRADEKQLRLTGPLTRSRWEQLRGWLRSDEGRAGIDRHFDSWRSAEPLTAAGGEYFLNPPLPDELRRLLAERIGVDTAPPQTTLVWEGEVSTAEAEALEALAGRVDRPLAAALRQIAAGAAAGETLYLPVARGIDQPPPHFQLPENRERITFHLDGRDPFDALFTGFSWTGELLADDAAALREWAQIPPFLFAVQRFLAEAAASAAVEVTIPPPVTMAGAVGGKLVFEPEGLRWSGRLEDAAEREEILALAQTIDSPLVQERLRQVLQTLDRPIAHSVPDITILGGLPAPVELEKLPAELAGKLSYDYKADTVSWQGPCSPDELRALSSFNLAQGLRSSIADVAERFWAIDDAALNRAWREFVQKVEAGHTVTVSYGRPLALPPEAEALAGRLEMTAGPAGRVELSWGAAIPHRVDLERLAAIREQADPLDEPFRAGIERLIRHISAAERSFEQLFDEPFPPRPETDRLPEPLRARLLIGRHVLRCQGIIPRELLEKIDEGDVLDGVDRQALRRLYRRAVVRGLNHGALKIATRRGAAPPAEQRPIDVA